MTVEETSSPILMMQARRVSELVEHKSPMHSEPGTPNRRRSRSHSITLYEAPPIVKQIPRSKSLMVSLYAKLSILRLFKTEHTTEAQQHISLIAIASTATVKSAFDLLLENRIHALPVYARNKKEKKYIGVVSVLSLLRFAMLQPMLAQGTRKGTDVSAEGRKRMLRDSEGFLKKTMQDVLATAGEKGKILEFGDNEPLSKLIQMFGSGVHRALVRVAPPSPTNPLVDDGVRLVSQTDLVRWLLAHSQFFPVQMEYKVKSFAIFEPVKMSSAERTLDGFLLMSNRGVSAVAIVDDENHLIDTLAASDLRLLSTESVATLNRPASFYLYKDGVPPRVPVTVNEDETLLQVIQRLVDFSLHKLWVVDGHNKLMGVVTMTDVCRVFAQCLSQSSDDVPKKIS
eukprot:CAMPEP_0184646986 /NCGR_PEP_ID=MMETSP0308-20130426/3821_1 /TAXON_ID=38269 /ORGANISM="Gloeochaete witrockiana, Strain SAG 46.84" /LENGTH=398 /DNA_ID=CAMNT_0027077543 /DNA_START=111 /DNA_END=1307 /DNA_ORIENTATION=-